MSGQPRGSQEQAIAELRHDLRTPLNHIIGYGEMLIEDAEERADAGVLDALRRIHATAKDLVGLIQNTLSPAHNEVTAGELATLRNDLQEPLQHIIGTAGKLKQTARPEMAGDLETIRSAAERLLGLSVQVAEPHPQTEAAQQGSKAQTVESGAQPRGRLLVVDDNALNRDLLTRRLEREGYAVVQATDGKQALETIRNGGVELVLLDIMMPEMDGYQVLEAMKGDTGLRDIPVLMISALDEIRSVVRCIEMGAEDYLPKPFDPVLLRARVGACLEKKRLLDEDRRKTEELERTLQRLRETQDQLIIHERLASLGAVSAGIAHEIKNPLNFVTNFSEVAMELTGEIRKELQEEEVARIADLLDGLDQSVSKIREHGNRADGIVRAMLLHSRGQSSERQKTDINALLSSDANLAYHGLRAQDSTFNCTLRNDFDPSLEQVSVIPEHLGRVFLNLINNACYAVHQKSKISDSSYAPTVSLSTRNLAGHVEIRIRDNGNGIPKEVVSKIFDPFFTTKPAGVGTGLGLSISYDIVSHEHQGELKVETMEGEFAEFIIKLPKQAGAGDGATEAAR
jgi:signal transduction histidine kinase